MGILWPRRLLVIAVVGASPGAAAPESRDYAASAWSASFYRPREVEIQAVGIVNKDAAFFQTRWGVSALHEGLLTPMVEVDRDTHEITAFHLCHHRSSIFYEVLARDGGTLSIFELTLPNRKKEKVRDFQDTVPATALACVDQLLLRASPASLLAVHLQGAGMSFLRRYSPGGPDVITSLTAGFAADVVSRSQIFAVAPDNRTVLRLHVLDDGGTLRLHSEPLLEGGEGNDGPLSTATAREPLHVLWARGKVLLVDGCSLREVSAGRARTLLGDPGLCREANETIEPAPWASRLPRPLALASAADATAMGMVLLLTREEVLQVVEADVGCGGHRAEAGCTAQTGCGWAEGPDGNQRTCLDCSGLEEWADRQRPAVQACSLEAAPRAGTRYSLAGCGCVAPSVSPAPDPAPVPGADSGDAAGVVQAVLAVLLVAATAVAAVVIVRRSSRRAAARELYGVDTAEFHTFTDDECSH